MPRLRLPRRRDPEPPPLANARIIVGLGNPGADYEGHRHNIGARALGQVAERLRLPLNDRSRHTLSGQGQTRYGPVVVARPRTLMNESGRAVQALLQRHRAAPTTLILIVDELDLELGRIRLRPKGGDGGQRGMRSIRNTIGELNFPRVRIGVGRPHVNGQPSFDPDVVADHLLSDPTPAEVEILRAAEARAADAVITILRDGIEAAMNRFNTDPPDSSASTSAPGTGSS